VKLNIPALSQKTVRQGRGTLATESVKRLTTPRRHPEGAPHRGIFGYPSARNAVGRSERESPRPRAV